MLAIRYFALRCFLKRTKRPLSTTLRDSRGGLDYLFRSEAVRRKIRGLGISDERYGSFVLTAAEDHKLGSSHLTGRLFIGERYALGVHISIEGPEGTTARAPENDSSRSPWKYRHFQDIKEQCVGLEALDAKDQRIARRVRATKGGEGIEKRGVGIK